MSNRVGAGGGGRHVTLVGSILWVAGLVWTLGVLVWPRLAVSGSTAGLDWQASLVTTLATIVATLLALVLTVGLAAVQLLSRFSWRSIRTIFDRVAGLVLLLVVGIGVALPLWVGATPSAAGTRWAFAGFGDALLLTAWAWWVGLERMTPGWLVGRAVRRGLCAAGKAARGKRRRLANLAGHAAVLAELVAAAQVTTTERRRAIVTVAVVTAARARAGEHHGEIAASVSGLALAVEGQLAPSHQEDMVAALAALGIDQAHSSAVHDATRKALTRIAHRARADGHRGLGHTALDGLVDTVAARLRLATPTHLLAALAGPAPAGAPTNAQPVEAPRPAAAWRPPRAATTEPTPARDQAGSDAGQPAANEQRHGAAGSAPEAPRSGLSTATLAMQVDAVAARERLRPSDIVAAVQALDRAWVAADPPGAPNDGARTKPTGDVAADLLQDTLAALQALLAAPRPESTNWPGGWQGSGALEQDLRRISRQGTGLYEHHQLLPVDAVEATLEHAVARLLADPEARFDPPVDRTGWRAIHSRDEASPTAALAEGLGELMSTAFKAGFDRRALLTGRRLLAVITRAAQAGDVRATELYSLAFEKAIRQATRHHRDRDLAAQRHRGSLLLAGLIAELDPLLSIGLRNSGALAERIDRVAETLAWAASGNPYPLVAATWQARLAAAGWPVPPPVPHTEWLDRDAAASAVPLPGSLAKQAEKDLDLDFGVTDPIWPAALLLTLWAQAVACLQAGDLEQAAQLRVLLTQLILEHDEAAGRRPAATRAPASQDRPPSGRALHRQLRRLADATVQWVDAAPPGRPFALVPRAHGARRLRVIVHKLLQEPGFFDRRYHGLRTDDEALVVVEEPDGSRRLLRDPEARARGEFTWGYAGGGPHALADALADDALADLARCLDCLGAAPCGAGLVQCVTCHGTGRHPDLHRGQVTLHDQVTSRLPGLPEATPTLPGAEWSLTRSAILTKGWP